MADLSFSTTAARFDADLAAQEWPADAAVAAAAVKPLADLSKGTSVDVSVAHSAEGGWAVVRIAPTLEA